MPGEEAPGVELGEGVVLGGGMGAAGEEAVVFAGVGAAVTAAGVGADAVLGAIVSGFTGLSTCFAF